jgi:uncharacterized protein
VSRTRKLDATEIRVLGVLLEKEQTTPDQYPLTTLAVVHGANQKTNRDPVTDLTETQVTEALDRLREDVLVWRTQSARAERWEHRLDRRWQLDGAAKAIMTLLLLRGPQTPGELRTRTDRMHSFDSVAEVEAVLQRLSEGYDALVRELPRQPGQRETRWMHLEAAEDPTFEAGPAPASPRRAAEDREPAEASRSGGGDDERLATLEEAVEELRGQVGALRDEVRALRGD